MKCIKYWHCCVNEKFDAFSCFPSASRTYICFAMVNKGMGTFQLILCVQRDWNILAAVNLSLSYFGDCQIHSLYLHVRVIKTSTKSFLRLLFFWFCLHLHSYEFRRFPRTNWRTQRYCISCFFSLGRCRRR